MGDTESEDAFKQVCEVIRNGKAVLWAGAGLSKYAGYPLGSEFATELAQETDYQSAGEPLHLPDVAEHYRTQRGPGAIKEKVKTVFGKDPISLKTHESLSLIRYNIPYIVTTNYDRLFEIGYKNDLIPVVKEEEVPDISNQGVGLRKPILYKPHGDVDHLDQLVITRGDYARFDRESFLWRQLCIFPAQFSMIFIGYSMEDENARELLDIVFARLGSQTNPHFIINRDVTEDDRARYKDFNVKWIAKDAGEAVKEVIDYVARYSFIDTYDDPARMEAYKDLWKDRNVRFDTTITGNRREISPRALDPSLPFEVRTSLRIVASKDAPELKALEDATHRRKCDSFELCGPTCRVKMNAEINGILLFDPDSPDFESVRFDPQADEEIEVDLQLGDGSMRLSNVRLQRHLSSTNPRVVIDSPWFTITMDFDTAIQEGSVTLKIHDVGDIEKGREIFTFLDRWQDGVSIQLISANPNNLWEIPSIRPPEGSNGWGEIHFWYRVFTDLSEIQIKRRLRLQIPEEGITDDDIQNIADAASLLRGRRNKSSTLTFTLRREGLDATKILSSEPMTFQFTAQELVETFEIFGHSVPIPFMLEVQEGVPANLEEARAQLESGADSIIVRYDGSVGELYQRYLPPASRNGDTEMTTP